MRLACARVVWGCALAVAIAVGVAAPASALTAIGYPDFSNVTGLQLNGSAFKSNDGKLELTDQQQNKQSSAFSTTRLDPGQSFATSFELSMADGSTEPADGMAFVLQNTAPTALGDIGGALGYGGISPSVAVEFDIFNGNLGDPGYVPSGAIDEQDQHVAITRNGDPTRHVVCATVRVPPDAPCSASLAHSLYGVPVFAWVDYSNVTHQLNVSVAATAAKPAHPTLTTTIDLGAAFGSSMLAGFTAATGQTFAIQEVLNWRLISGFKLPAPDSDRDGIPDSADHCPTRAAGRYDRDHDGCPGPYSTMHPQPRGSWDVLVRGVRFKTLAVSHVPAGGTVRLRCRTCHVSERTRARGTSGLRTAHLHRLDHRTIPTGHSFTVTVTAPGYIGELLRFVARAHGASRAARTRIRKHPFRRSTSCLPPGSRRPAAKCPTRPA